MDDPDDPFVYNTIEIPTVIGLLRNILTQYPDSGHIVKELIQNAEDAGASCVEVTHDTRVLQLGGAHKQILRFIRGPALCLYNNATFTEADWQGIRKLSDSIKKDDPLKVGQFGLGFKSVFHLTDYVCILSGGNILFMDPSEQDKSMCRSLPLNKLPPFLPPEDCLHLWGQHHLLPQHLQDNYFPGTIFWFPLRQQASKLSDTVYSKERVEALFESFGIEAPICLTFLKSIETVNLKSTAGHEPIVTHGVELCSPAISEIRSKRKKFREELAESCGAPSRSLVCDYEVMINCNIKGSRTTETLHVLHYLPGVEDPARISWSRERDASKHMPLVGVAASLKGHKNQGHIFSFLPLPKETANNTKLPIQLHGYFVLDQNRRHVKWRTEESSADPEVLWNEGIVSEVIKEAYGVLLLKVLEEVKQGQHGVDTWYSLLPDVSATVGRWNTLATRVWKELMKHSWISSKGHGFVRPKDVRTVDLVETCSGEVSCTVKTFLDVYNVCFAELPEHISRSLASLGASPDPVTPKFVRARLRMIASLPHQIDRAHLLEYILSDDEYIDLQDIALLPLEDGTWRSFSAEETVYIFSDREAQAFVGIESKVLRRDLTKELRRKLELVAHTGVTGLKVFKAEQHGAALLSQSAQFVQTACLSQQQLSVWLQHVWLLLQQLDLQPVAALCIVPTNGECVASSSLVPLYPAIVVQDHSAPLTEHAVAALDLLQVKVIGKPPNYVKHLQLHHYVHDSDTRGVTQALLRIVKLNPVQKLADKFNMWCDEEMKKEVCSLLEVHNLKPEVHDLLRRLHIFKANGRNGVLVDVCIESFRKIVPHNVEFPVHLPETLITPMNDAERNLAIVLGATEMPKEDLCLSALQNSYSESDTVKLVNYVLSDYNLLCSKRVQQQLKQLRFVPSTNNQLHMPNELYDPEDAHIDGLIGEHLLPHPSYKKYLSFLRKLGLKKVVEMAPNKLVLIIRNIQNCAVTMEERARKVKALLTVVDQHPQCQLICQQVQAVPFVLCVLPKPAKYPHSLTWASDAKLLRPDDVKSYELYKNTLGSVMPLVDCSSLKVAAACFGWNNESSVHQYIKHFLNVRDSFQSAEIEYFDVIKSTYRQLSKFVRTTEGHHLQELAAVPSVFTGEGFQHPKQVYLSRGRDDLQCLPYMCPLPYDLCESKCLFQYLGSFEDQSMDLYLSLLRIMNEQAASISVGAEHARRLAVCVLERLVNFPDLPASQVLLPVETEDDTFELIEKQFCSFTDQSIDWLSSEELEVKIVHSCVGPRLAKALGVSSLNKHLLAGEESVLEWGQREPLTTRLHNLLRQYRDGVAVFKELVQNADDAGASTVAFLYDERDNRDSQSRLISGKFAQCQGPAVWAYNDAVFREEDFSNLRDIGGATKEFQSTKIGKFGLGFCSVYNLTDVPSFVSGSSYIVFDPHLEYLEGDKPGVRYNFQKQRNRLMKEKLHGQFHPFDQVFDCNIHQEDIFNGTLFRFPLRTTMQAAESKISNISYSSKDMIELLAMFQEIVGEILLFTQNIKKIQVFHLEKHAATPTEKVLLFESSRYVKNSTREGEQATPMRKTAELFSSNNKWNGNFYEKTCVTDIEVTSTDKWSNLNSTRPASSCVTWLTSWHSGSGSACKLSEKMSIKALPLGAVAVPMRKDSDGWMPVALKDLPLGFYRESHLHCFLPLPVKTPLPVHINGFFEVADDRTNLRSQTDDDRQRTDWNLILMEDCISDAYHSLLGQMKHEGLSQKCPYYFLWPTTETISDSLMSGLSSQFHRKIVNKNLEVFRSREGSWHPLTGCRFLEVSFSEIPEIGAIAFDFMEKFLLESSNLAMVTLPRMTYSGFANLKDFVISDQSFFTDFFANITKGFLCEERRNKLILHIIDTESNDFIDLTNVDCIPAQPRGNLCKAQELVDPYGSVSGLFTITDGRFPVDSFTAFPHRHQRLLELGMKSRIMPTEWLCERACTVQQLSCYLCAVERSQEILLYIGTGTTAAQNEASKKVKDIPFLPVQSKPNDWPVGWKASLEVGDKAMYCSKHPAVRAQEVACMFSAPSSLYHSKCYKLVGSLCLILQPFEPRAVFREVAVTVLEKVGVTISPKNVPLDLVMQQLKVLCRSSPSSKKAVSYLCHAIYEHLERLSKDCAAVKSKLLEFRNEKILVTRTGFVEPILFAVDSEADCSPNLFSARMEGLGNYPHLLRALGVQEGFTADIVLEVLLGMIEKCKNIHMKDKKVLQMSKLLGVLYKVRNSGGCSEEEVVTSSLCLPDSTGYLQSVNDLCVDDEVDLSFGQFKFLHSKIQTSQDMLNWLNIKSKTKKRFEDCSFRLHFGQSEPLTTRLKNILEDYPCDVSIMKELLQNADDAGATEVVFIKDFRQLPQDQLFDKTWAPLQGPALSVYNNKGFSVRDLKGIQDLGNSCKKEDPASTGQYGIGFNAVYHITDAPSFLTRGPHVPEGETLCMFDPHCWYDPFATPEKPGVRLTNLASLRKDHQDSFKGYLEDQLFKEEGTLFRLPLRTNDQSAISKFCMSPEQIELILKKFQQDMNKCLLFLRNVTKISVVSVSNDGKIKPEYSVKSSIPEGQESELEKFRKKLHSVTSDDQNRKNLYDISMERVSYQMNIADNEGKEFLWHIVQQLGSESSGSVPEAIKDAFFHGSLSMLPSAGVAVLLESASTATAEEQCTTSCYLPLPCRSGLPFSVNGHFTLNSSRRDLWTGQADAKAVWNNWLMKEVLAPTAVCALDFYKNYVFRSYEGEIEISEKDYAWRVRRYYSKLPSVVEPSKWETFVKSFYEYAISHHCPLFDMFTPSSDRQQCSGPHQYDRQQHSNPHQYDRQQHSNPRQYDRKGTLSWHALEASETPECMFPVYFLDENLSDNITDTLKRLGMKIGSKIVKMKLDSTNIKYHKMGPQAALQFLQSWTSDCHDRCVPMLNEPIEKTPFLKVDNAVEILKYISEEKKASEFENLPVLVTNDSVLTNFSAAESVFVSRYCCLLPELGKEFVHARMVYQVTKQLNDFLSIKVVKPFTPEDLAVRLPNVLGEAFNAEDPIILSDDSFLLKGQWLQMFWQLLVGYVNDYYAVKQENCSSDSRTVDWKEAKKYLLSIFGNWAVFPVQRNHEKFLIQLRYSWRVLDLCGYAKESIFYSLPMYHPYISYFEKPLNHKPYIPIELDFSATLKKPSTVLDALYFGRSEISFIRNKMVQQSVDCSQKKLADTTEILEYFGKNAVNVALNKDKLKALNIFHDVSGKICNLEYSKVYAQDKRSSIKVGKLLEVTLKKGIVLLEAAKSDVIAQFYEYLQPNCITEDLDIFADLILPSFDDLEEQDRLMYLGDLSKQLLRCDPAYKQAWSMSERKVITALKQTKFIKVGDILKTANAFYDPDNKVFKVMKVCNLPNIWQEYKWQYLLKLAGMIDVVSPEMFASYARSMSSTDPDVMKKSEVLLDHFLKNYNKMSPAEVSSVAHIEFLVPWREEQLERLFPFKLTASGLVCLSKAVHSKFSRIVWSSADILPDYVTSHPSFEDFQKTTIFKFGQAPNEFVLEHVQNLCSVRPKQLDSEALKLLEQVMEHVYEHLENGSGHIFQSLQNNEVPIVYIPQHKVFVPCNLVIENGKYEIVPYLYKAPVRYGKYFSVFDKLGSSKQADCTTYAQVLERIFEASNQQKLHPEESRKMKLALGELVLGNPLKLKDMKVQSLYLPTRDGTLAQSSQMFVADNNKYVEIVVTQGYFREPVFAGFQFLKILKEEEDFVYQLPQNLRPKFMSEVFQEELRNCENVNSNTLMMVNMFLQSSYFENGVLRLLNHYRVRVGSGFNEKEKNAIRQRLKKTSAKQVEEVKVVLKHLGNEVGEKKQRYYILEAKEEDEKRYTFYMSRNISSNKIREGLGAMYRTLLQVKDAEMMATLSMIIDCVDKPHDVGRRLDEHGIKLYGEQETGPHLYITNLGSYLPEEWLDLLDNEFCQFDKGEIVCMKKYLYIEDDDPEGDDIFMIVMIDELVEECCPSKMNKYRVEAGSDGECFVTVKAHQLYRFVRDPNNTRRDVVPLGDGENVAGDAATGHCEDEENADSETDKNISEKEIMKRIRTEVIEIWSVQDEKERRHLLRRLMLKWHPDKNMDRAELCTRVMQYIQSLMSRLEKGETIPDDDQTQAPPHAGFPSGFYSNVFDPPRQHHRRSRSGASREHFYGSSSGATNKMPDHAEARKWHKQAEHDYRAAQRQNQHSACWTVYMCHQALEKMLVACLYQVDRDEAQRCHSETNSNHYLPTLASFLPSGELQDMIKEVQRQVGQYQLLRYPTVQGCPCDAVSQQTAAFILTKTGDALLLMREIFDNNC